MRSDDLKRLLLERGATVVGVADVTEALNGDLAHLQRAVSFGIRGNLNPKNINRLIELQRVTEQYLRMKGYRFLSIPPDSDRQNGKFVSRLYRFFCHKTAATCAGLGWVGRNGLVINPEHGPRLSWATVLTDAPLEPDPPVVASGCRGCDLCVKYCPSGAITGKEWSRDEPFVDLVDYQRCADFKNQRRRLEGRPNCGLCITVCPYGRSY